MRLNSDRGVVAERPMYFNYRGRKGGHCVVGATAPSSEWYFAEGTTRAGFDEYITVQNPNNEDATLYFNYMIEGKGAKLPFERTVSANSRATFTVKDHVGEGKDVSLFLESTMGVVAERPMYFNDKGRKGGHCVVGATAPSERWYFAEGTTRDGFDEYITVLNPHQHDIAVTARYMPAEGQGGAFKKSYTAAAGQRLTIRVNDEVGEDKDVSVRLTSEDNSFVAERPTYFNLVRNDWPGNVYNGGSVCMGGVPGKKTYFAEGYVSPQVGIQEKPPGTRKK